jgi:hypothetical protein
MTARRRSAVIAVTAAIAATLVLVTDAALPRGVAGVLLVAALPGWAALAALRLHRRLDPAERVAFAATLSLAITVLAGLALHATALGFGADAWAVALGGISFGLAGVALVRGEPAASVDRPAPARPYATGVIAYAGAVALLVAAVAVARDSERERDARATFAELSAVADSDRGDGWLRLEVRHNGPRAERYTLELGRRGGEPVVRRTMLLAPGERWSRSVAAPAELGRSLVVARLFRPDRGKDAYRRVEL